MKLNDTCGWWLLLVIATPLCAQSLGTEQFEKKIRPVLVSNCYGCHSSKLKKPMGGLVLDTKAGMLQGGTSGPAIVPGKPENSLLIRAIAFNDPHLKMPPTGKLAPAVVADFEQWIAAGAEDPRVPAAGAAAAPATGRVIDYEKGRQWWAFQPVHELPAPAVKQAAWKRSKIDAFVLAKLEKNGLKPSPEADARMQIERASLDLTGLRPTYEEIQAYVADTSRDRYEKLVDRLLASPQYGERWARYWLDVARYGEESGSGQAYTYAWRYRDWVIESLNNDLPYDRFLKLQLAADQLPGAKRDDLRALGYLALAPVEHKELKLAKDMIESLYLDEWDERVDAVSRGFMGLSVSCARCHDHKFDPISNKDYYALAGIFASTAAVVRPLDDLDPAVEKRFLWVRERLGDLDFAIKTLKGNDGEHKDLAAQKVIEFKAEEDKLKAEARAMKESFPKLADSIERIPSLRPQPPLPPAVAADKGAVEPIAKPIAVAAQIRRNRPTDDPKAPYINAVYDAGLWLDGSDPDITTPDFHVDKARDLTTFFRGSAAMPGDIVPRRFPMVLAKQPGRLFERGSGRLDLAEALFTDAQPLVARVIVNRVWGWHFDKPIVGTPSDFGARGDAPTNPELLNDLTARFIAHGWSMKWLHREIMLSAAYRQSSHPRADGEAKDPANQLLWRMNPRRMDIEAYRDSLLKAAGELSPELYGPSVDGEAADNMRRTIYTKIGRGKVAEFLRLYDFPSPFQHSPTRNLTITPLQQLFVMNSPFIEQLGTTLAKSVAGDTPQSTKVRDLYRKTLARDPSANELDAALSYLNKAPMNRFAQILLATNEEIFWP